jgi:flagellar biosynthesis chaperone FliJ
MNKEDEQIAKHKLFGEAKQNSEKTELTNLQNELSQINQQLVTLTNTNQIEIDETPLLQEAAVLSDAVNESKRLLDEIRGKYYQSKRKRDEAYSEIGDFQSEKQSMESELLKLMKRQNDLTLYKEAGSFFTNLEVKACPHCETEISDVKSQQELTAHVCKLCGEPAQDRKIEDEELASKE